MRRQPVSTWLRAAVLALLTGCGSSGAESAHRADAIGFDDATRVVLHGAAASGLIGYCGQPEGVQLSQRALSVAELQQVEGKLWPLLQEDLLSEGSKNQAQDYYRQYAAADWKEHRLVYVLGFHKRHVKADAHHSAAEYWKLEPVIVSDGGVGYWCATYIQDTGRFIRTKEEGGPVRTVRFNGYG